MPFARRRPVRAAFPETRAWSGSTEAPSPLPRLRVTAGASGQLAGYRLEGPRQLAYGAEARVNLVALDPDKLLTAIPARFASSACVSNRSSRNRRKLPPIFTASIVSISYLTFLSLCLCRLYLK